MRGDIGVLIRQRREELEKTQEEMAEELHIRSGTTSSLRQAGRRRRCRWRWI